MLTTTAQILVQYLDSIFELLRIVQLDANRTEALLRSSCGVIGYVYCSFVLLPLTHDSDLAEAFPNGDIREYFRHDFLTALTRDVRANADFTGRTRETARWAREQIKRQVGTLPASGPLLSPTPTTPSFRDQPQYPQHIFNH